ncbi:aminotransferase class V-fold PLP-dependent enzyme [Herbiconiux sp. CPCC 205716]|uniref:Aminotransferase class V-fold PLP-dependent enzyme n=1 Tax=Herbiconiux gentiana TaxID=2970912 RepID=A0ABT2GHG8_9MICO|nr:aminotransferase class V-fold PLP-dependent enzyme [Herbiconiux gentiana]MCS5715551.1 aminotransferase class V-fold PLP-dependent enzyme [Herbiconiux gentiana]
MNPGYLNHASYGPPTPEVESTVHQLLAAARRGEPAASLHAVDERARAAVARVTGFAPEGVALSTSTSQGLMTAAAGLRGEVLVSLDEFPANLYPWLRAEQAGRMRVRPLPGSGSAAPLHVTAERVADALTPSTRVLAVSAVDFRTGYRADLGALRKVIGPDRLLVVDGIQNLGAAPNDWTAADVLAVGGQKWLRAGWGTGFLALSPRGLDEVAPVLGGWTGVEHPAAYDGIEHPLLPGAERYSVTSLSPFATGAFATALEQFEAAGPERVADGVRAATASVIAAIDAAGLALLSPRASEERAGIVVAGLPEERAAALHTRLAAAGVTTTLHPGGRIRFSPHAHTPAQTLAELPALLAA